jgi:putative ABC transport system permease protein
MIRIALKGALAHKLRLALTALAIVLGVSFVAGTYVFTDTIQARFDTLFTDVYSGVDATVRPVAPDFGEGTAALPQSLLDEVASVDGVDRVAGSVEGFAQFVDTAGDPIGGQGPPTLGYSWVDEPALNPLRIEDGNGRAPTGPGEVVVDAGTARANDLAVGDEVRVQFLDGTETFTVVGWGSFGTEDNLAGATIAAFELSEAQRLFGLEGSLSSIDVVAADGVSSEQVVDRITASLPSGTEAVTGAQRTDEDVETFAGDLGFLTVALLAFAGVAVFVGAFIIQNTFRIIVAQRTRELALLRAVGASARQVMRAVVAEALAVAVVASLVGVVAGVGFALMLKALMEAVGFGMPEGPLTILPRTIVVAMAVGIVVTLVSAIIPARKAQRVPPVAAMRADAARPGRRPLRTRAISGGAVTAIGAGLIGFGLVAGNGSSFALVGFGALVAFLGVSVLAPLFAGPVSSIIGRPLRGITGRLARENAVRQPRRTASTASALMVGVALVTFVSIFAASVKASVGETIDAAFPTDLAFSSTNLYAGVGPGFVADLDALDETATVSAVKGGEVRIDGDVLGAAGVDPATIGAVYDPDATIDLSDMGSGMLVHEDLLESRGWAVGDVVDVEYPLTGVVPTTVAGTYTDTTFSSILLPASAFDPGTGIDDATIVFADLADGVDIAAGQAAASTVLADFANVDMNTKSEQIAETEAQVDQLLVLFTGLLGLAILVAVLGITNTLALSIVERTREIGLLRAVGMASGQVRRVIRWEAVIIALFGAVLGTTIGLALGWAVVSSLADQGLGAFTVPFAGLATWLVVAALAGVLAAVLPARRAGRLDVLQAISYE